MLDAAMVRRERRAERVRRAGVAECPSVWADEHDIWTNVSRAYNLDVTIIGPLGSELSRNTGNGWKYVTTTQPAYKAIGPFTASRMALWAPEFSASTDCSLATVDRNTDEVGCELTVFEADVVDVFGVNDQLAYYATTTAVFRASPSRKLFDVAGHGSLWANEEIAIHALSDESGVIVHGPAGTTTLPPPPGNGASDIWATGADDIWLIGRGGLRHWNGQEWREFETGLEENCAYPELEHLWGAQGRVYAASLSAFGELTETGFQVLHSWCGTEFDADGDRPTTIGGMRGMPDGEHVLLLLRPSAWRLLNTKCMDAILVMYDGTEFRRI